jgi:hypothetical protein
MTTMQRKMATNRGRDSHVRDFSQNAFKNEARGTYQILVGEIDKSQPEPLFSQNLVSVKMARGGSMTSVAYPGAFIEPVSGNLHGTYEGPIAGQMVMVGFENGNSNAPMVVNRYPYQGTGNTFTELAYKTPLTKAFFNAEDVIMGHKSGSFLVFNTGSPLTINGNPGSVKIKTVTELTLDVGSSIEMESVIDASLTSPIIKLTGSTNIQLNGDSNFAIKYTELKSAFDTLKTDLNNLVTAYNTHIHITTATVGPSAVPGVISPTASAGVSSAADMSGAKNDKVLM